MGAPTLARLIRKIQVLCDLVHTHPHVNMIHSHLPTSFVLHRSAISGFSRAAHRSAQAAGRSEEERLMKELLTTIVLWLSTNFPLSPSYDHPRVEFVPATEIAALRFK